MMCYNQRINDDSSEDDDDDDEEYKLNRSSGLSDFKKVVSVKADRDEDGTIQQFVYEGDYQ